MKVTKGDPIAAVTKAEPTLENKMFGKIHKSLRRSFSDDTLKWDKDSEGEIVDVERNLGSLSLLVRTLLRSETSSLTAMAAKALSVRLLRR